MKKLLIATAALAMVAGTAQAQSSVSVYGIMDMSYGENKVTGDTSSSAAEKNVKSTGLADDAVNSSRIGFRGTEDLGGGVKAGFVVEANLDMVRGTTFDKGNQTGGADSSKENEQNTAFLGSTRQSMLTLSDAKLGTLGVGYKKTLETDFNDTYFTGTENSAGNQAHVLGRATRANGIYYTSPAFSGVTATVQYTTGESTFEDAGEQGDAGFDASMTQIGLNYSAGALQVGAVYFNGSVKIGADGTKLVTDYTSSNFAEGDNDYKGYGIGANYNFGFAKVTAQMGERKYGLATDQDKNEYTTLGVTFPVGKLDLMAAYSMQEIKTDGVKQNETNGYQLIARYNLSKRTNVYALVGEGKKETADEPDVKTSVARVGVAHSF
jgi:predicted porin